MADKLHGMLVKEGVVSFLDREGIGTGSSWRTALNRCITDADVFVSVIEGETRSRRWVAGELIAAVAGRAVSGSPRIIALLAPDADGQSAEQGLPAFSAVLKRGSFLADDREPRVITVTEGSLATVASDLRPVHYDTASVFPGEWTQILKGLTLPIVTLGPLGELLGLPAAVLFYLEYWSKTAVGTFLADHHLLDAACVIGGYLAGFSVRLIASTAFEVRHRRGRAPTIAHGVVSAGLAAIVILWCQHASWLATGWAIVLAGAGWYLAELFLQTVRWTHPELFIGD